MRKRIAFWCAVGLPLWTPVYASSQDKHRSSLFRAPLCTTTQAVGPEDEVSYFRRSRSSNPPVDGMLGRSEDIPMGAIDLFGHPYDWALHPRISRGNEPRRNWRKIAPWGQVYIGQSGGPISNTRVQLRNLRLFVRVAERPWCMLAKAQLPHGGFYDPTYKNDHSRRGAQRVTSRKVLEFTPTPSSAFHFFADRYDIPSGRLTGMYADFEARLVLADAKLPDDRGRSSLVASAGIDYWQSASAKPGMHLNEDAAIGKFRRLSPRWTLISVNTSPISCCSSSNVATP